MPMKSKGFGKMLKSFENTIRALIRGNADFPALKLGKKIIVDVPGLYEWLHARNGMTLSDES